MAHISQERGNLGFSLSLSPPALCSVRGWFSLYLFGLLLPGGFLCVLLDFSVDVGIPTRPWVLGAARPSREQQVDYQKKHLRDALPSK